MLKSQSLSIERSEKSQRVNELLGKDKLSTEERSELDGLSTRLQAVEVEFRAAVVVESAEAAEAERKAGRLPDAELRERLDLRARADLTNFIQAALQGRTASGAEAELQAAAGCTGIPLEIFEPDPRLETETRVDAATEAPTTGTGSTLAPIRPAVFSASIAARLGIEMPRTGSGGYSEATIDTSLSAASVAAGADANSTPATFRVATASPKRISARLSIRIEDVAKVGQANFSAALRQNLMLKLSDELDRQLINGAGSGNDLTGLIERLTAPADPVAIVDFDAFIASFANEVDGLWALDCMGVAAVVGPASYRLAAQTFQTAASFKGETSAATYLMKNTGGFWTNSRMPDPDNSNFQQGIAYKMGMSTIPNAPRTAVAPTWNEIAIDDIYSDSASGTRHLTMHILVGDVLLVQPNAYARIAYQVA